MLWPPTIFAPLAPQHKTGHSEALLVRDFFGLLKPILNEREKFNRRNDRRLPFH